MAGAAMGCLLGIKVAARRSGLTTKRQTAALLASDEGAALTPVSRPTVGAAVLEPDATPLGMTASAAPGTPIASTAGALPQSPATPLPPEAAPCPHARRAGVGPTCSTASLLSPASPVRAVVGACGSSQRSTILGSCAASWPAWGS